MSEVLVLNDIGNCQLTAESCLFLLFLLIKAIMPSGINLHICKVCIIYTICIKYGYYSVDIKSYLSVSSKLYYSRLPSLQNWKGIHYSISAQERNRYKVTGQLGIWNN